MIEPPAFPEDMMTNEEIAEDDARFSMNEIKPVEVLNGITSRTEVLTDVLKKYPVPSIAASLLVGAGAVLWMRGLTRVALYVVANEFEPEIDALKRAGKEAVVNFVSRRLDSFVPAQLDS